MKSGADTLDLTIREALDCWSGAERPEDFTLWPTVRERLQQQRPHLGEERRERTWNRMPKAVVVPLVCILLAACGVTVAAAASPAVRSALHHLLPEIYSGPVNTGYSSQGAPLYMRPVPAFSVFYPANVPAGMTVRGTGHPLPGGLRNSSPTQFGLTNLCPNEESQLACSNGYGSLQQMFPPAKSGTPFFPAVVSPLVLKGVEAVWFGFHVPLPGKAYVSIGEWKSSQYSIDESGTSISINGHSAYVQRHGNLLIVSFKMNGTSISVESNVNQERVVGLIASLQRRPMRQNR